MRRYLIILSALGAAIIVMSLVKAWQRRRAEKAGLDPSDIRISTSVEQTEQIINHRSMWHSGQGMDLQS